MITTSAGIVFPSFNLIAPTLELSDEDGSADSAGAFVSVGRDFKSFADSVDIVRKRVLDVDDPRKMVLMSW